ncbi:MAG TPA: PhnD/SsuA/transferrin family substrate-binding protein [Vicinamibacterales bacterium]|nr:PhnD/SsuA/transferrin family substrate-binding protein [Vicinamibacterales bacterium]
MRSPVAGAWRRRRPRRGAAGLLAGGVAAAALAGATLLAAGSPGPVASQKAETIRLGVVGFYNPRLMYLKYQPLVDYLTEHTRWRFELDLSSSYRETVSRLCAGTVQIAYLGPFTYLRAREACGVRPVVRLNSGGQETYRSYILVREDSAIRDLAGLRGRTIAYGALLSTSSHLMPRLMLQQAGLRPGVDIACRYYQHHERAARAVLLGDVSACGIRDLVGDQFKGRGLKVLARSQPIVNFPLALGPGAPPDLERALVRALVALPARDPAIAERMAGWDVELSGGFAPVAAAAYEPLVDLARRVYGPQALTAPADALACAGGR